MPYWNLFYHLVWSTKERLPLLSPSLETEIYPLIVAKGVELGGRVLAVGGTENHIHVIACIPPKIAVSEFIRQLKGASSHLANQQLSGGFGWQNEYGAVSFGEKQLERAVEYVENQKRHHAGNSLKKRLEQTE